MTSDKSNDWQIDNGNIHVNAHVMATVSQLASEANRKFRNSLVRSEINFFPYLFNVVPLKRSLVASLQGVAHSPKIGTIQPPQNKDIYNGKSLRDFAFQAIADRAILKSSPEKKLISPNGANYNWMIDMRRVFLDAITLTAMADLFWEMYADKLPFQIGGMEVAAIPLLSAILTKSLERGTPVNGLIIRKERKTYGEGKQYEGVLTDDPIVIIDDLMNSGNSLEKVRVILEQENRKISEVFVVIDYESFKGMAWRQQHLINVTSLFKIRDFDLVVANRAAPQYDDPFRNVWSFESPTPNFFHLVPKSFPATDGKRIYFGSDSGNFWCLDAATSSTIWSFKVASVGHKNIWSAPVLCDGRVYFGAYDGNVYCLDAETGKEIWRFIEADWVGSSPALAPELGLLFIGLEFAVEGKRGSVIALRMESGERVWEYKTRRYTHASPAYWSEKQLVACGSNDNEMLLFDATTGKLKWRFETKGEGKKGSIRHAPAFDVKRNQLVTGCADGYIYVIDVETGKEVWSIKTDNTIYTVPLVAGDLAFVGSTDKYFYILDLENQTVKKKIYLGSKIFCPPRLIEGNIYFGTCSGGVYEISFDSLEITGHHQLPDAITCALTYSPETKLFYALTYVNQMFAMAHA